MKGTGWEGAFQYTCGCQGTWFTQELWLPKVVQTLWQNSLGPLSSSTFLCVREPLALEPTEAPRAAGLLSVGAVGLSQGNACGKKNFLLIKIRRSA